MKSKAFVCALALFGASGFSLAQETRPAPEARSGTEAARVEGLIEQLGAASYRDRRAAEKELRKIGKDALGSLKTAAKNTADPEIQWRAERLVQELSGAMPKGGEGGLKTRKAPQPDPKPSTRKGPPGGGADPGRGFGGIDDLLDRFPSHRPGDPESSLDEMRKRMDEIRAEMDRQLEAMRRGERMGPGFGGASRSMSVQIGPDGVRVEREEVGEDGKPETKVYEAPDMEAFRRKHPGVLRDGLGGGFGRGLGRGFFGIDPLRQPGNQRGQLQNDEPGAAKTGRRSLREPGIRRSLPAAPVPEGHRLGVMVREMEPALQSFFGGGLQVGSVVNGSLAESLGVEPGDVILRIGERRIRSVQDVAKALAGVPADQKVTVTVSRRGESKTLVGQRPGPAPKASRRTPPPRPKSGR